MRFAVLIDAENAQHSLIADLLSEIAKYGVATVRRIYGDFTTTALSAWRTKLLEFSIQPIQQFRNTVGKNASDSALIIDAMDLLHSHRFDGFCIVSSDSDFTSLARRIREEGLLVYGFGQQHTPKSFVAACDRFIYTEVLRSGSRASSSTPSISNSVTDPNSPIFRAIRDAVNGCADDSGWAQLAAVGNVLLSRTPEFDSRTYGFEKLGLLVEATRGFDVKREDRNDSGCCTVFVRPKPQASSRVQRTPKRPAAQKRPKDDVVSSVPEMLAPDALPGATNHDDLPGTSPTAPETAFVPRDRLEVIASPVLTQTDAD